jgi:ADP-heptose:LPS heptosyltransferase/glycosyltransferase involved in cell wall biosynthesis
MANILLVGEHPLSYTGNANMMQALFDLIDRREHNVCIFAANEVHPQFFGDVFVSPAVNIIPAYSNQDTWGKRKLLQILATQKIDILIFVGLDIWRYVDIFDQIEKLRQEKSFKWVCLFPYDLQELRGDWMAWINYVQFPVVYSKYGRDLLIEEIPKIKYFRPPLRNSHLFRPPTQSQKKECRDKYFPNIPESATVFGFIGANQIRKGIPRLVKGFAEALKREPNMILYMHTNPDSGVYRLRQLLVDYNLQPGQVLFKSDMSILGEEDMHKIYWALDSYINVSVQEGLSWTVLEALLCGLPVIASDSTAHTELVKDVGYLVKPTETEFLPLFTATGPSYVEGKACSPEAISEAFIHVHVSKQNPSVIGDLSSKAFQRGMDWLNGVSHIDSLLEIEEDTGFRKPGILFAQHSSAGDVLMTTQVFKGLKERHPGKPLIYMTQPKFQGILKNNPYIDEIIDWDRKKLQNYYEHTYSPHTDKIVLGGWNQLDVKLYEMYYKLTGVEPDNMFMEETPVKVFFQNNPYVLVQTTGGDPQYRTYEHMSKAIKLIKEKHPEFTFVQIGNLSDDNCKECLFDLRGRLTWGESAFLMRRAKAAIVIDSFPAHLAGYTNTPAVILFGPAPARVTQPRYFDEGTLRILLEPDRVIKCSVMTTCWGNPSKARCTRPCINEITPEEVCEAFSKLREVIDV